MQNLTVGSNATLTIEPGTVLKFDTSASLTVNGQLLAEGTPDSEIYFTSLKDDSVRGDTNGDGSATNPAKGDWQGVWLTSTGSKATLDSAMVRYGGHYGNIVTWYSDSVLTVRNSIISESSANGIYLAGNDLEATVISNTLVNNDWAGIVADNSVASIQDNIISNNGWDGISATGNAMTSIIVNNTVSNNGDDGIEAGNMVAIRDNTVSNNGGDGIEVQLSSGVVTPTISNNTIISNTRDAIFINYHGGGGLPILSGNTIIGNGLDREIGFGGTLGVSMTLPINNYAGFSYVIQDLTVDSNATLAIEPGTVLKFDTNSSLSINGQLLAEGTPGNEIYFTSLKDDSVGGDTNGDGNATTPARGDWGDLTLSTDNQASLDYAVVRYGGAWAGSISIYNNAVVTVNHSTISESGGNGIYLSGSSPTVAVSNSIIQDNNSTGVYAASDSGGTLHLENNMISNNEGNGIAVDIDATISGNTVSNNGGDGIEVRSSSGLVTSTISNNTIISNTRNAILIDLYGGHSLPVISGNTISGNGLDRGIGLKGTLGVSMTLSANTYPGFTYVINGQDLTVGSNATLTIEPGMVLKFDTDARLVVKGQLLAESTLGNEIYFTSLKDDSVGGDTNGDGNATTPAKGDWNYLQLTSYGQASLDYAVVRYGGDLSGNIFLWYNNGMLTVNHSTISESGGRGIDVRGSPLVTVTNSSIQNNDTGISAHNANVQAVNNWWGDPSGPFHPSTNPNGQGDGVSDGVIYDPWLISEDTDQPVYTVSGRVTDNSNTPITGVAIADGVGGACQSFAQAVSAGIQVAEPCALHSISLYNGRPVQRLVSIT